MGSWRRLALSTHRMVPSPELLPVSQVQPAAEDRPGSAAALANVLVSGRRVAAARQAGFGQYFWPTAVAHVHGEISPQT